MTSHKVNTYFRHLGKLPEYKELFTTMYQLHANQIAFSKIIPSHLAQYCSLGKVSNGKLTVMVENGAIASKLKQISPSLLPKLKELGWEVTAIQILVQANFYASNRNFIVSQENTKKKIKLSQTGKDCLLQLIATMPGSELKETIRSFVKKHDID
ncbi:MAG: DUF721 domain-containing protein [Nitrosomonas sp.]|nr:MAG: DUF721 domain-containing protein [Nitrosomonas sp.]